MDGVGIANRGVGSGLRDLFSDAVRGGLEQRVASGVCDLVFMGMPRETFSCLLYTSDAADDM
eukprot:7007469-Alexandrium_andersonii.AAC.1